MKTNLLLYVDNHNCLKPSKKISVKRRKNSYARAELAVSEWWYREKRPPNDNSYFENMSRIIFQAGLNWHVIDKKWPTTKKAFLNFSIEKVSRFTEDDVERLMKNEGIVRNRAKILAIIRNAIKFKEVEEQCGSFQAYIDSLDKSNNYAKVVKELNGKFKRLGPPSASLFLYTVAEKISPW